MRKRIEKQMSFGKICVTTETLGEDWVLTISGGEKPHIGCSVLAVPRPSLTGDGSMSCTSSVLNVTGHKDEVICRLMAEEVCKKKGAVTLCCGGIHMDGITQEQILEVVNTARILAEEISRMK